MPINLAQPLAKKKPVAQNSPAGVPEFYTRSAGGQQGGAVQPSTSSAAMPAMPGAPTLPGAGTFEEPRSEMSTEGMNPAATGGPSAAGADRPYTAAGSIGGATWGDGGGGGNPLDSGDSEEVPWDEEPGTGWGDEWQNVWEQHNQSLDDLMSSTYSEEARMGRGAAAMSAMSGRSGGGGLQGGMTQANIAGAQMRQQARMGWMKQGLNLRLDYLGKLYADAQREDNQEMMAWVEDMRRQTDIDLAEIGAAGEQQAPTENEEAGNDYFPTADSPEGKQAQGLIEQRGYANDEDGFRQYIDDMTTGMSGFGLGGGSGGTDAGKLKELRDSWEQYWAEKT